MALLQVNFNSRTLKRCVPMQVILPVDDGITSGKPVAEPRLYPTLYLLHGLTGNCTEWVSHTRIQMWAEQYKVAVVMPSGENSFYVDVPAGGGGCYGNFGEYIGQELVEMTRKMFPLSHRREDTFLAGLSMGGYGALRNGFLYNDTFGYVAGLSAAIHFFEYEGAPSTVVDEDKCFGDLAAAQSSSLNPRYNVQQLVRRRAAGEAVNIPKAYIACGTEDFLFNANKSFAAFLQQSGVDVTFEQGPGEHNWEFWDTYILHVLNWLPLAQPK